MKTSKPVLIASAALALAVLLYLVPMLFVICFGRDWNRPLQNGYSLVHIYSGAVIIVKDGSVVIDPNIDKLSIRSNMIVGHVSTNPDIAQYSVQGYFIVDTKTGQVFKGLTQERWLAQLRKRNVNHPPTLRKPTRPLLRIRS